MAEEKSSTLVVVVAGAAIAIGVAAVAFYLLTKDTPFDGVIPIPNTCTGSGDCPAPDKLQCADCMGCHPWLKRCVYKLKESEFCRCVPGEKKGCDFGGTPGQQICEDKGPSNTDWGKCDKF